MLLNNIKHMLFVCRVKTTKIRSEIRSETEYNYLYIYYIDYIVHKSEYNYSYTYLIHSLFYDNINVKRTLEQKLFFE